MLFIYSDSNMNYTNNNTIKNRPGNIFKDLKKEDLDDCYICLSSISNKPDFSAVFVFKCRHPICLDCLNTITSKYTDNFLNKMLCCICRTSTNKYLLKNRKLQKVYYSQTQSIMIPKNLITDQNIHSDHIQRLIAYSTIY